MDRAYARISLDNERSGSIVKQRARLTSAADGEPVFYIDESVSGAKVPFAERPAGARLLADLARGDRLLVTKIDRAARNVRDLLGLVERVERAGASIVFVDQNLDTGGAMGRFMLTLLGAVAELEAAIVAERVRETRDSFRAEGRFGGGPVPFGFATIPNPHGRGLVLRPDPLTAPQAREVIERVLAGEPQRQLAPLLGLGEPGLSRWLRNPLLAGLLPGSVEPDEEAALLSPGEWRALQDHLARPEKAWARTDGYGAALSCAICGSRLYLGHDKRNPDSSVYRCGRRLHADGDPAVAVNRRRADAHVEAEFLGRFGGLPVVEEIEASSSEEREAEIARARLRLDAVRRAQDAATTEEEDDRLAVEFRKARAALRAAEALPDVTATVMRETGLTFAQTWATADDATRTALLLRHGPWVVEPGRGMRLDAKVHLADPEPDYLAGQV